MDNDGGSRITLTAIVGFVLSISSGLTIAWLIDLLPIYDQEAKETGFTVWHNCPIPIPFAVTFYPDYNEFDREDVDGIDSLINIHVQATDAPDDDEALANAGCNFEFWTDHEVLNFQINHRDGQSTRDIQYLDFRARVASSGDQYVIEPDPVKFAGSLWMHVPDLTQRLSYTDRKISTYWAVFNSSYENRADPSDIRTATTGIVLPFENEAKRLFPRTMSLDSEGLEIYRSPERKFEGHLTQNFRTSAQFSHPRTDKVSQALLIAASTLFGAGISAMLEAFLASGILRLHRQTAQRVEKARPTARPRLKPSRLRRSYRSKRSRSRNE